MFCILTDEMNTPGGELIRHLEGRKNILESFFLEAEISSCNIHTF